DALGGLSPRDQPELGALGHRRLTRPEALVADQRLLLGLERFGERDDRTTGPTKGVGSVVGVEAVLQTARRTRQGQRIADAQFEAMAVLAAAEAAGSHTGVVTRLVRRGLEERVRDAEVGEGRHGSAPGSIISRWGWTGSSRGDGNQHPTAHAES